MIRFDPIKNRIYNDERSIKIGYRETRVLELLLKKSPEIVRKQDIISFAWGSEFIGETSLAKCISLLRQGFVKLGIKETPIVTVPKVGYRLIDGCVLIESQPQIGATTPLTPVSDHISLSHTSTLGNRCSQGQSSIALSLASSHESKSKQTTPVYHQVGSYRNRLCYFTTGCLLLASALLAFAKVNERNLSDINPVNRLNEQWIGQVQVFQDPEMAMTPELESILYQYQCDCVAYVSEEPGYSELSVLNKATRQSVNIFYTSTQLDQASTELALFLERGQL
ncbi:transcriptional regulator [Vibrio splendidus]|uniref:winged helix-turn-helix domain-containing protein n=1 Tax=Vibrio TaxID=662 RepID=UPI000D3AE6EB|nr:MULTISPECIES: winged helix-turn-helix domain-containing protein [Vibrio]MBO7913770.1 winged helix-turn-helix domain-containing protein [Vibrio sp. G41H]MBT9239731.1 winged helix-turn-helix domain-containing protein [Vibrio splendidus]MCF7492229.1 winged helix-turn-helix domain-containing protein [Vibrio sp. G-C-1]MDP2616806.1 winged helix-turn-helix domain-containing protein [Vibrio splendidus]PTP81526.1 transcriptional regulator [Vibrio splendidus]